MFWRRPTQVLRRWILPWVKLKASEGTARRTSSPPWRWPWKAWTAWRGAWSSTSSPPSRWKSWRFCWAEPRLGWRMLPPWSVSTSSPPSLITPRRGRATPPGCSPRCSLTRGSCSHCWGQVFSVSQETTLPSSWRSVTETPGTSSHWTSSPGLSTPWMMMRRRSASWWWDRQGGLDLTSWRVRALSIRPVCVSLSSLEVLSWPDHQLPCSWARLRGRTTLGKSLFCTVSCPARRGAWCWGLPTLIFLSISSHPALISPVLQHSSSTKPWQPPTSFHSQLPWLRTLRMMKRNPRTGMDQTTLTWGSCWADCLTTLTTIPPSSPAGGLEIEVRIRSRTKLDVEIKMNGDFQELVKITGI